MQDPAARFTLRQLSCFVAACEGGGIGGAAARLHLAQATVSAAIGDLERTLGVQLLVRGRRRAAVPSPAGRELLAQAAEVLAAAGRLDERSASLRGDVSGELAVGCLVTLAPAVAPAACRAFEQRWPRARVALVPAHQAELLERLDDGRIAVAITYDLGLRAGVEFAPLAAAPPYALVAETHPLAGAAAVGLEQLAPEPFVLLDLPLSRDYFLDLFRAAQVAPDIARRVADAELARSRVAWGYCYTLANARPAPTRAADGTPLRALALRAAAPPPHIGLARRAGLEQTRAAAAFAVTFGDVIAERWEAPA
jgi:DNA-binding transcriptional LysR family regulator